MQIGCSSISARYAARDGTCTCAITCTVRPSVRLDADRHRLSSSRSESSLSETLEQIALALLTHTSCVAQWLSVHRTYVRIVFIAIDEIISAVSNRVIGMFRGARDVFAQRHGPFYRDMIFRAISRTTGLQMRVIEFVTSSKCSTTLVEHGQAILHNPLMSIYLLVF